MPWSSRRTAAIRDRALAAALAHPKAAILTAPGTAAGLARDLHAAGKRVYAVELLGTPEEKVSVLPAETGLADPNILISLDQHEHEPARHSGSPRWLAGHPGAPDGWALPEDAFEHRDSMITKPEVRALVLARLGPAPGRTIWDVGAGSGSVAVECARFGAWVIAIESDPAQCEKIRGNAERHRVRPRIVHGPRPGGAGRPADRGRGLRRRRRPHRAGRRDPAGDPAADRGHAGCRRPGRRDRHPARTGTVIRPKASSSRPRASNRCPGGNHRLAAQNPVFVLWGQRGEER